MSAGMASCSLGPAGTPSRRPGSQRLANAAVQPSTSFNTESLPDCNRRAKATLTKNAPSTACHCPCLAPSGKSSMDRQDCRLSRVSAASAAAQILPHVAAWRQHLQLLSLGTSALSQASGCHRQTPPPPQARVHVRAVAVSVAMGLRAGGMSDCWRAVLARVRRNSKQLRGV